MIHASVATMAREIMVTSEMSLEIWSPGGTWREIVRVSVSEI